MRTKVRYTTYLILIIYIVLALTSCSSHNTYEGKLFRWNIPSNITSLDPAYASNLANIWGVTQLYNGLVQFDQDMKLAPCIAKSWKVSENGLIYTFTLREDVYFHDHELFEGGKGRQVTAHDVAYSFYRIIDPKTASTGNWVFSGKVDEKEPFKALDDHTFQIKLKSPYRPMMSILTMPYCFVVPKEITGHYGKAFGQNPVGTGPFQFTAWSIDEQLNFERNPNYFEEDGEGVLLPYIDFVKITFNANRETEAIQLLTGDVHFVSGVVPSTADLLIDRQGNLLPQHEGQLKIYKAPYLNTEYVGIMMAGSGGKTSPTLKDKRVRQAINYGFDRETLIRNLRNNIGRPANGGFIPYGLSSFNAESPIGYTYDPDKSRQLLAEAGHPGGQGLEDIVLTTSTDYQDMGVAIARQLENIGIRVKIETHQSGYLKEIKINKNAPFFRASWIADFPDGENYLSCFYGGNGTPPNYTTFNHPAFDSLYVASLNENDDATRIAQYRAMDQILVDEAPLVPMYYDEIVLIMQQDVEGLMPNPMNFINLKRVKITSTQP